MWLKKLLKFAPIVPLTPPEDNERRATDDCTFNIRRFKTLTVSSIIYIADFHCYRHDTFTAAPVRLLGGTYRTITHRPGSTQKVFIRAQNGGQTSGKHFINLSRGVIQSWVSDCRWWCHEIPGGGWHAHPGVKTENQLHPSRTGPICYLNDGVHPDLLSSVRNHCCCFFLFIVFTRHKDFWVIFWKQC